METTPGTKAYADQKIWFSMWFLSAIVTFGIAFFPMFYRLVEGRNRHFMHEAELESRIAVYTKKQPPVKPQCFKMMNSKAWAASIILIIPVFIIAYLLSRDLAIHEQDQDAFLASVLPTRIFMPQTIPIKTYALITIVTFGVGVIYWLYKVVNLYNAHFKAHQQIEKELVRLDDEKVVEHM